MLQRMGPLLCYQHIPCGGLGGRAKVVRHKSAVCVQSSHTGIQRRSANYKPTIWHDHFIQSINIDLQEGSMKRTCILIEETKKMIRAEEGLRNKLELVDILEQIGVAYHFKEEIGLVLHEIHVSLDEVLSAITDDIYFVSLLFRIFRIHGFPVSQDIFQKYIDCKNGNFKANLCSDTKGMLSLYEASYLAHEEEDILEKARQFTTMHLNKFLSCESNQNATLRNSVAYALELPQHWRMLRLHTCLFIDKYKIDEKMRPILLELAVLDFNLVQSTYKKELKEQSSWWAGLGLYGKLPFIRDRLVENYLWSVGCIFEPNHSSCRKALTQTNCLVTTIDDIYDIYGSLDELELFTEVINKWDVAAAGKLPEYMKICFLALLETIDEHGREVMNEKGLNIVPHLRKSWTDLCNAYLVEAKWYHNKYTPKLEEYLENAWISISGHIVLTYVYCMNQDVTALDLEKFLHSYPDVVRLSSIICRLWGDLATSKAELARGDVSKSIQCYMHEKGVSEYVAREKINEMIVKYWKLLNGKNTWNCDLDEYFKKSTLNIPRMAQCFYKNGDGYGEPDKETKDQVISLLFEPIKM